MSGGIAKIAQLVRVAIWGSSESRSKNIVWEQLRKTRRQGGGEGASFPAGVSWDGDFEAVGMEEKAAGGVFGRCAINGVAENGSAEIFEVNAELVGAAGGGF